jgi:hypothetical protein
MDSKQILNPVKFFPVLYTLFEVPSENLAGEFKKEPALLPKKGRSE